MVSYHTIPYHTVHKIIKFERGVGMDRRCDAVWCGARLPEREIEREKARKTKRERKKNREHKDDK